MPRALRGVDAVVHLAAEVGVGQNMYAIARYVGVNDLGTAVLMEALARTPVRRVVVASSMSIYEEGLYRTAGGDMLQDVQRHPGADHGWDPRARAASRSSRCPPRSGSGPRSPPSTR